MSESLLIFRQRHRNSVLILFRVTFSGPELKEFPSDIRGFRSVFLFLTPGVMGEYEPKIEVQFPEVVPVAKSSTVKLECFALGKYVPLSCIMPQ